MQLFSKVTSYLGVDIGTSSIKIVELENYRGQAKLKSYGYADLNTNILRGATDKNNQLIANYIKEIVKKSRMESRQAIAALPTFTNSPLFSKKESTEGCIEEYNSSRKVEIKLAS